MKTAISIALRVIALTVILFTCFAVAGGVLGLQGTPPPPGQAGAAGALLAACFLDTLVLTQLILRSRWAGWRLIVTVFLVFYGVMTLMSQIESAVFITRLPSGVLPRLFLMGALVAGPFSALAVLILGKRSAPWLLPFQIFRALLWTAIALPVIRMMKGRRSETALAIGLLFAVLMNARLLLPNPYMPAAVRMTHLIETASSNLIFAVFLSWLLTQRHEFALGRAGSAPPSGA